MIDNVKDIVKKLKKQEETKGKDVSEEHIKKKIQSHIATKNQKKNEKQSNRMGTNKRKQVIEHIEDDETDTDEVSVQPT